MDEEPLLHSGLDTFIEGSVAGWARSHSPTEDPVVRLFAGSTRLNRLINASSTPASFSDQQKAESHMHIGQSSARPTQHRVQVHVRDIPKSVVPPPPPASNHIQAKNLVPSPLKASRTSPINRCGHVTVARTHCLHVSRESEESQSKSSSPNLSPKWHNPTYTSSTSFQDSTATNSRKTFAAEKSFAEKSFAEKSFLGQTESDMARARTFLKSLMRVERIVHTSIRSSRNNARTALSIFSGLDTSRTGILNHAAFSLACRRLRLGLSRTDVDALIALLRSRRNSSHENLVPGCIKWRWFMNHFFGMTLLVEKTNLGEDKSIEFSDTNRKKSHNQLSSKPNISDPSERNDSSIIWRSSSDRIMQKQIDSKIENRSVHDKQKHLHQNKQSADPNHMARQDKKTQRPTTADNVLRNKFKEGLRSPRSGRSREKARPSSSSAATTSRTRKWKAPLTRASRRHTRKRPSSVPHRQQRHGAYISAGKNKVMNRPLTAAAAEKSSRRSKSNSLASMASAMQRHQGANWVMFSSRDMNASDDGHFSKIKKLSGGYSRQNNRMGMMPKSPIQSRKRHSSPLTTARLRPFFGS